MQNWLAWGSGSFVAASLLAALGTAPPMPALAESTAESAWRDRVEFHVVDPDSKAPVAGVSLLVEAPGHRAESVTDAKGRAEAKLPAQRPTYALVRVRLAGRVPLVVHWHFDQPSFVPPQVLELPMPKAVTIGGVVKTNDGLPVAGAKVALIMRGSNMGGATQEIFPDIWERRVDTDQAGRWSFHEAPPGRESFSVAVEHPEIVRTNSWLRGAEVRPFYEGRGETIVRRGQLVTGQVVDEAGAGVKATLVLGESASGSTTYPEYKTDNEGRFTIGNAAASDSRSVPGRAVVTVFAKDFAPELLIWDLGALGNPVTITLHAGKVLRVRVVNEKGEPVAGVQGCTDAIVSRGAGGRPLRVLGRRFVTDKEGRFTWKHAPEEPVSWDFIGAKGYRAKRDVVIDPKEGEVVIALRPVFRATGKVTDSATGRAVAAFRVTPGQAWDQEDREAFMWNARGTIEGHGGRWIYEDDEGGRDSDRNSGVFLFRIAAEGYRPVVLRRIGRGDDQIDWDVSLKKSPPHRIRVVQADGRPAGGATVAWNYVRNGYVQTKSGKFPSLETPDGDGVCFVAAADGIATVMPEAEEFDLVAAHESGWGWLRQLDLAASGEIKLHPWATIEIRLDGLPAEVLDGLLLLDTKVRLDCPLLEQLAGENKIKPGDRVATLDHLVAGIYKIQLARNFLITSPRIKHVADGEVWRLNAADLWKWCRPSAMVQVPRGARVDREGTQLELDYDPGDLGVPLLASQANNLKRFFGNECWIDTGNDGLSVFSTRELGVGRYHLHGKLMGAPAGVEGALPPALLGLVDYYFTIPDGAVKPVRITGKDTDGWPGFEPPPPFELAPVIVQPPRRE